MTTLCKAVVGLFLPLNMGKILVLHPVNLLKLSVFLAKPVFWVQLCEIATTDTHQFGTIFAYSVVNNHRPSKQEVMKSMVKKIQHLTFQYLSIDTVILAR